MSDFHAPIGVFDSGMGGISILKELVRLMPNENYVFFGDSAHAPYGIRSVDEVKYLTLHATEHLLQQGCKAIVVACNTATSAAISTLRSRWPELPIIGLEPALKPAVLACPGGRVLVMATPLTLREHKFAALMQKYQQQATILTQPAPNLVEFVERVELDSSELLHYLRTILQPYIDEPVDSVVLGCTHFPFAQNMIREALGYPVRFFDGGAGAARETCRLLERADLRNPIPEPGHVQFETSGDINERLPLFQFLLNK